MCGRFVSSSPPDELARYFDADQITETLLEPRFNVAPTATVYAVVEHEAHRRIDALHWGLVPFWARDLKVGAKMINARSETLADKSAFRAAFRKRRCIVPVDGFYEWKQIPGQKHKQPHYITRRDGEPLAFAGLWERWVDPNHREDPNPTAVRSCTIVTCAPNELMAPIHDRMPVLLPPGEWDRWLDPTYEDTDALQGLLGPCPAELLQAHPVSTEVNRVRNDHAELVAPVAPTDGVGEPQQGTLL